MKTYILWAVISPDRQTDTIVLNGRVDFFLGYKRARFSNMSNEVDVSETFVTVYQTIQNYIREILTSSRNKISHASPLQFIIILINCYCLQNIIKFHNV